LLELGLRKWQFRLNGEIFRDGILEAVVELGRKQLELVPKSDCVQLSEASYTVRPCMTSGESSLATDGCWHCIAQQA
jgi:hypothetical protein